MSDKITEVGQNNIISIDEMGIYLNDLPTYGWAKKGERCEITNKKVYRKINKLSIDEFNKKKIMSDKITVKIENY